MRPRARQRWWWRALAALVLVGAGCRYGKGDVDRWKGTVKGPGRLVAVVLADKYDDELRSYAASALVDMERADVDGVAELKSTVEKLDPAARGRIIDGLVPALETLMQADPEQNDPERGPPARQIRAKDAAFALVEQAGPEARKKLTEAIVRWYTVDFTARSLAGAYSAEQVVRALGSSAAASLVDALAARLPQQALVKLAELIAQTGDEPTRARAADKLVQIEAEMRGAEFVAWLHKEIVTTIEANGDKPDPARVEKSALLTRDRFLEEGALPAMKHLADEPKIIARLLALAATPDPALATQRTRALQALEGKVGEAHLDALLALALDANNPTSVRDYAFDRVADVRSPRALGPMWPLLQDTSDPRLRWRAGELVLALGGSGVVEEFFLKLPAGEDVAYEPEELDGYATRMGQMAPPPVAALTARLGSPTWRDRVLALKYFERRGTAADLPRLQALVGDAAPVRGKGWAPGTTVGKVAEGAIAGLRDRVGGGQKP